MGKHPEHSSENEPRGESLPARLRLSVRRGVSLVELMISMLILAIVCVAWMQIIGVQSASRESFRREAVERLAGMMDAFLLDKMNSNLRSGTYHMSVQSGGGYTFDEETTGKVPPVFSATDQAVVDAGYVPPIGYLLRVVKMNDAAVGGMSGAWESSKVWLVGTLYDEYGRRYNSDGKLILDSGETKDPFFELPVYVAQSR